MHTHGKSLLPNLLTPVGLYTGEKFRGAITSIVSGSIAGGLNFAAVGLGMSPVTAAAIFLYAFGSVLGYSLDIVFAKREFRMRGGQLTQLPYAALGERARWLLRSFAGKQFYRYLITVIIDTLIGLAILRAVIAWMDRRKILAHWKFRNAAAAGLIAIFTFFLYANILRFDWAYRDGDEPLMNLVVLMWSTMVMMIYAVAVARPAAGAQSDDDYTPRSSGQALAGLGADIANALYEKIEKGSGEKKAAS